MALTGEWCIGSRYFMELANGRPDLAKYRGFNDAKFAHVEYCLTHAGIALKARMEAEGTVAPPGGS
jgi:hypothetical protein